MANKKITDLTLRGSVDDAISIPSDDGIQSYRLTIAQLKAHFLAAGNVALAALNTSIFNGLTAVTPALDDYFPLIDVSDSNLTKKGLVGSFKLKAYTTTTLPYTLQPTDETVVITGASGTLTWPTAVGVTGKRYTVIHGGTSFTQQYTFATTSGQTLGGLATTVVVMHTAQEVFEYESNGAVWNLISHYAQTPWTTATVTSSHTANVTVTAKVRRRGMNMDLWIKNIYTGATTAANLTHTLPNSYLMDTTQMPGSTNNGEALNGRLTFYDSSAPARYTAVPYFASTSSIGYFTDTGSGAGTWGVMSQSSPGTVATGDFYSSIITDMPIVGWQP